MPERTVDALIIGSGFGGSVVSYRLAKAGHDVVLLERGKSYPPGSFPRSPHRVSENFWDPSAGKYGMFNVWSFSGLDALVSSGLGGGSLIYANVLLRKQESWFYSDTDEYAASKPWPVSYDDLKSHYTSVENMIGIEKLPMEAGGPYRLEKTERMRRAATKAGRADQWDLLPLAVSFTDAEGKPIPGEPTRDGKNNLHGRTRRSCNLCGECDIGCNEGSKNTLDYNYLSRAKDAGADIQTLCEVISFEPVSGGVAVDFVRHDPETGARLRVKTAERKRERIIAKRLILSAGTLGSTYLMMRNQANFSGGFGPLLGHRFCGNGDLLGFALDAPPEKNLVEPTRGPVITSAIHARDILGDGSDRGLWLEDAGVPPMMMWGMHTPAMIRSWRDALKLVVAYLQRRLGRDTNLSREISNALGKTETMASVLPLLGMGCDTPDGKIHLNEASRLAVDWQLTGSRDYFSTISDIMTQTAEAMGARYMENPLSFLNRVITVHPLGGCTMGTNAAEGVVDPHGGVFNHDRLYVADGSVLPGPVGANPALTIAAVADRIAERIDSDLQSEKRS